jgi:5-methylthioadenosine/S-adenosylhomocysteine deaminase
MKFENIITKIPGQGLCRINLSIANKTIQNVEIVEPFFGNTNQEQFYVTPGFVNCHLHPNQLLDRRMLDELSITQLIDQMHIDYKKTDEERYTQALLVLIEAIKSGATSICSVATSPYPVIQAYKKLGLKGAISCFYNDRWEGYGIAPTLSLLNIIEKHFTNIIQEQTNDIKIHIGTASVESASNDLLVLLDQLAKRFSTLVDIHICEGIESVNSCLASRNTTPVNLLSQLKVLSPRWNLIHGVNITNDEIQLISEHKANFIHCPVSNAKTGIGIAPIKKLLQLGVKIGLGSDACSNNNTNNILNEAYFATLLHSAFHRHPSIIPLDTIIDWLTQSYKMIGLKQQGIIAVGEPADLLFWSLNDSAFSPLAYGSFNSALLYNAPDLKPHTVLINGRIVVENYKFTLLSEEKIKKQVNECGSRIQKFRNETHGRKKY